MNTTNKNLAEVYVAADEIEARYLERLLSDNDIECSIVGAGLIGGAGELPPGWSLSPRIWVDTTDRQRARTIIDRWEQDRNSSRSDPENEWKCPSCLAVVPGEFEICWQCQFAREPD